MSHDVSEALPCPVGSPHRPARKAVILWCLFLAVIGVMVGTKPDSHTVTPEYRKAAEKWWGAQEDMYGPGIHGFLYFPTGAILYTPFTLPPKSIGEVAWRVLGIGLLALSLWRWSLLLRPKDPSATFWILSLLSIPAALASARNGQANLHMAALMLLAATDCARARWAWAAALLTIALALKPLTLVMVLLCFLVYPQIRKPVIVGLVAVALLPWLHPHPDYVWGQYLSCARKLDIATAPFAHRVSDLVGMFSRFNVHLSHRVWLVLSSSAALLTAILAFVVRRRGNRTEMAFILYAFSAAYLMLFNPRTESNSYVLLAPVPAVLASLAFARGRKGSGWAFVALALAFAVESLSKSIYEFTDVWFKPAVTAFVVVPLLIRSALRGDLPLPETEEAPAGESRGGSD